MVSNPIFLFDSKHLPTTCQVQLLYATRTQELSGRFCVAGFALGENMQVLTHAKLYGASHHFCVTFASVALEVLDRRNAIRNAQQ